MQHYLRAIISHIKRAGLPVYTGRVPNGAAFPYILLSAAYAPFCQNAAITLTAWFFQSDGHARCVDMLDTLCTLFPEKGEVLLFRGGSVLMTRAAGDFLRLVNDETDPRVIGGRMRLTARIYDL